MRHDIVADLFSSLNNAEKVGKHLCTVPASKLVKNILQVMQKKGYIGNFEFIDNGKSGFFKISLIGRINYSKIIKPRFSVKKNEFEKWEMRYLPGKGFGILILSTPMGVMDQYEAQEKGLGGKLLGFVF